MKRATVDVSPLGRKGDGLSVAGEAGLDGRRDSGERDPFVSEVQGFCEHVYRQCEEYRQSAEPSRSHDSLRRRTFLRGVRNGCSL